MKKSCFTEQQILDNLQEAQKGETSVVGLCRQHSIHQAAFYLG
ncbi:transposase [Deinococcus misasensis]